MWRTGSLAVLAAVLVGCNRDPGDHPPRDSTPMPTKAIDSDSQYVFTVQGMT
jgi:hypothetical protein